MNRPVPNTTWSESRNRFQETGMKTVPVWLCNVMEITVGTSAGDAPARTGKSKSFTATAAVNGNQHRGSRFPESTPGATHQIHKGENK
jgi:hypothetical protein